MIHGREQGITLIELLVTLSVAAILLAIAAPSFTTMLANNRAQSQSALLFRSLNYARSEAVRRSAEVYVSSLSGTTDWAAQGWHIWSDLPSGTAGSFDAGEDIQVQGPLPSGTTLTGSVAQVTFLATGFQSDNQQKFNVTERTFSYSLADKFYCTVVGHTGRVSIKKTTTSACP